MTPMVYSKALNEIHIHAPSSDALQYLDITSDKGDARINIAILLCRCPDVV